MVNKCAFGTELWAKKNQWNGGCCVESTKKNHPLDHEWKRKPKRSTGSAAFAFVGGIATDKTLHFFESESGSGRSDTKIERFRIPEAKGETHEVNRAKESLKFRCDFLGRKDQETH